MKTFKHSGDLGDLIYSLPTIRNLGGGALQISLSHESDMKKLQSRGFSPRRYPTGHLKYDGSRAGISLEGYNAAAPLLNEQNYLSSVSLWRGEEVDYDLDESRIQKFDYRTTSLCASYAKTFSVEDDSFLVRWLSVPTPRDEAKKKYVLFSRSFRYRNPKFPWRQIAEQFRSESLFVGFKDEWEDFVRMFGPVTYAPTTDLLQLARLISGCALFIGNQSLPYAIAEGLKVNCWQETYAKIPNCLFRREGARYFIGRTWTTRPDWYLKLRFLTASPRRIVRACTFGSYEKARKVFGGRRNPLFYLFGQIYSQKNEKRLTHFSRAFRHTKFFPLDAPVLHSQGLTTGWHYQPFNYKLWDTVNELFFSSQVNSTAHISSLTILTTSNLSEEGPLEKSLKHLNWNPARFVRLGGEIKLWNNVLKIELINDYLSFITTPYVLFCDSHDVLVTDIETLLKRFYKMDCEMLCNAEKRICHPKNYQRKKEKKIAHYEQRVNRVKSPYVFLNSGVWIAKTSFALEFFSECSQLAPLEVYPTDDQIVFKHLYPSFYPRMRIDIQRNIFQTLQFAEMKELRFRTQ